MNGELRAGLSGGIGSVPRVVGALTAAAHFPTHTRGSWKTRDSSLTSPLGLYIRSGNPLKTVISPPSD